MTIMQRGISTVFVPENTVLAPPIVNAVLREVGLDSQQFLGALGAAM